MVQVIANRRKSYAIIFLLNAVTMVLSPYFDVGNQSVGKLLHKRPNTVEETKATATV